MYRKLIVPLTVMIVVVGFILKYFESSSSEKSTSIKREPNQVLEKESTSKKGLPKKHLNPSPQMVATEDQFARQIPKLPLNRTIALVSPSTDQLRPLASSLIGQKWKWWLNAALISKNDYSQTKNNKALAEVSQRIVVEKHEPGSTPEEFFPDSPLVLFNSLKQSVGVLTGVFVVTAKSEQDFNNVLQDQNFEIVNSFSHLRLVYLKPRLIPFNLSEVENTLSIDQRVQSIEYEILKGNLVKN